MPLVAEKDPGVLLSAVFDKKSKALKTELAAMVKTLEALQKKHSLSGFITATKRVGDLLHIKVLAASSTPTGAGVRRAPQKAGAGGGGWSPQARAAREVAAQVQSELAKKK